MYQLFSCFDIFGGESLAFAGSTAALTGRRPVGDALVSLILQFSSI